MAIKANLPAKLNDYSDFSLVFGDQTGSTAGGFLTAYDPLNSSASSHPHLPLLGGKFQGTAVSPDGKLLCIISENTDKVTVVNLETGARQTPQSYNGGIPRDCAFSPDSTKLAVVTESAPYLQYYNVSDMLEEGGFSVYPNNKAFNVRFHPDGTRLFIATDDTATSRLMVYALPSKTHIPTPNATTGITGWGSTSTELELSNDGALLFVFSDSATLNGEIVLLDTTTYGATNPTLKNNMVQTYATLVRFSPDGSKVICIGRSLCHVLDVSSGAILMSRTDTGSNTATLTRHNIGEWVDNQFFILMGESQNILKIIDTTNNTLTQLAHKVSVIHKVGYIRKGAQYEIVCSIVESLAEADWEALAITLDSNTVIGKVSFTGTTFTIPVARRTPCTVIVRPKGFGLWEKDHSYALGDNVYPTNPSAVPYYYECAIGGVSGVTEPTWSTTSGSTTADGTISWTLIEGVIKPDANQPVIPTPV